MSLPFNPIIGYGPLVTRRHGYRSYRRCGELVSMQFVSQNSPCPTYSSTGLYQVKGSTRRVKMLGGILACAIANKNSEDVTQGKKENSNESRQNVEIPANTSNSFGSSIPTMSAKQKSQPQEAIRNLLARDGIESDSASSQTASQKIEARDESMPSPKTTPNSSPVSSDVSRLGSSAKSSEGSFTSGKLSLSAKEKLRTARSLTGFAESDKPGSPQPGKSILDALRESDKLGKTTKYGQPVEPSNLFDDKKRGSSAEWGKFVFSLGPTQLSIFLSFLLISSIMFGTTYFVWKVGAIHYNEF